jgi:site-specific DNA-methyltransferase (adenine-specific)
MPEQLLGRIIRCCSNPMEIVLDPFGGSGTTLAVAKKLGRQWIGFELSKEYVQRIRSRLKGAKAGDPLDGAADPLSSVPTTAERQGRIRRRRLNGRRARAAAANGRVPTNGCAELNRGIIDAFKKSHAGHSVDQILADPELASAFTETCLKNALPGAAVDWNLALLRIRKAGKLPRLERSSRALTFAEMDAYSFASEIALQHLSVEYETTLDGILCDPRLAERFDEIAASFAPGYRPFEYRWAALAIRKRAKQAKRMAVERYGPWLRRRLPPAKPLSSKHWQRYAEPGAYVLISASNQPLYVGETLNLCQRIESMDGSTAWATSSPASLRLLPTEKPYGLQPLLIHRLSPVLNCRLLLPEISPRGH